MRDAVGDCSIPIALCGDDPDGWLQFFGPADRSIPEPTREDLLAAVREAGGHRPDWVAIVKQWREMIQVSQTDAGLDYCVRRLREVTAEAEQALAAEGMTPEQIAEALA